MGKDFNELDGVEVVADARRGLGVCGVDGEVGDTRDFGTGRRVRG